jgi:hypothetical protein
MSFRFGVVTFFVGAAVIGCFLSDNKEQTPEQIAERRMNALRFNGVIQCESVVRNMLVSPSTAVFEPGTGRSRIISVVPDSGIVRLSHFVDSQNRMGGTIRTRFYCELQHTGDDFNRGWRVVDVTLLD